MATSNIVSTFTSNKTGSQTASHARACTGLVAPSFPPSISVCLPARVRIVSLSYTPPLHSPTPSVPRTITHFPSSGLSVLGNSFWRKNVNGAFLYNNTNGQNNATFQTSFTGGVNVTWQPFNRCPEVHRFSDIHLCSEWETVAKLRSTSYFVCFKATHQNTKFIRLGATRWPHKVGPQNRRYISHLSLCVMMDDVPWGAGDLWTHTLVPPCHFTGWRVNAPCFIWRHCPARHVSKQINRRLFNNEKLSSLARHYTLSILYGDN